VGKLESRPWIVSDELWSLVGPLLPEPGPKLKPGRPRVEDRQALCGILFVLHTGLQWEYLPQELGFGSGMTCRRRLAAWNEVGVWDELHLVLLKKPRAAKKLDWSRPMIDSSHMRAARRGPNHAASAAYHVAQVSPAAVQTPVRQPFMAFDPFRRDAVNVWLWKRMCAVDSSAKRTSACWTTLPVALRCSVRTCGLASAVGCAVAGRKGRG
jgi:transposase